MEREIKLSQETIKLIEKKPIHSKSLDFIEGYLSGVTEALTDPAVLKSMNLYTLPEMQKQMQDVFEKGEDKWVRVEDRLPDDEQNVLCYQKGIVEPLASTFKNGKFNRYDNWTEGDRLMSYTYPDVLYWIPLVKPPLPSPTSITK